MSGLCLTLEGYVERDYHARFPYFDVEPDKMSISLQDAGMRPHSENVVFDNGFVSFYGNVREVKRVAKWDVKACGWSITGLGRQSRSTCGSHRALYSDGEQFTRTRETCNKQSCPVCSWKWEAKAGDRAVSYMRSIVKALKIPYLRHCCFSPANVSQFLLDKCIHADMDPDTKKPRNSFRPGDMRAFQLDVMVAFMTAFHDVKVAGPLVYAYVLHPGREPDEDSDVIEYEYSPHVHLITNFTFGDDPETKERMIGWYFVYGFTFETFWNKISCSYNIPLWPETLDDGKRDVLRGKVIYVLSHSLLKTRAHAIVYGGMFAQRHWDINRKTVHRYVRSDNGRMMYQVKELGEPTEEKGSTVIEYEVDDKGKPVPRHAKGGGMIWLRFAGVTTRVNRRRLSEFESVTKKRGDKAWLSLILMYGELCVMLMTMPEVYGRNDVTQIEINE